MEYLFNTDYAYILYTYPISSFLITLMFTSYDIYYYYKKERHIGIESTDSPLGEIIFYNIRSQIIAFTSYILGAQLNVYYNILPQKFDIMRLPIDIFIFIIFNDVSFYFIHRLLHHKKFYWIHKLHHKHSITRAWHANYMSFIEAFIVFFICSTMWCLIFNMSIISTLIITHISYITFIKSHSGFCSLSNGKHDIHHYYYNYNYGNVLGLDHLFGTYKDPSTLQNHQQIIYKK